MIKAKARGIRFGFLVEFSLALGLLLAFFHFSCLRASADELQVTDYLGLTRAQKEIGGKVAVTITVKRNEKEELDVGFGNPLLVQRTGVSPNIEGIEVAPMTYEFRDVSAGVWRIRLRNKGLLLDKVEIAGGSPN